MVKLQNSCGRFWLHIPKDTVKFLGLVKGEDMVVIPDENKKEIIIKRAKTENSDN